MFEGKTFLGATGTPSRKMALVIARFEDWLPEPLTVATRIVKSLTARAAWEHHTSRRAARVPLAQRK